MKTIIVAYIVIAGMNPSNEVNKKISEGWQPYGSISCSRFNCRQPMVKTKEVPEDENR